MVQKTISHWDKYPVWTPGRKYLICLLTFADSETIVAAARKLQADLASAPVAICPPESLHQTMPGAAARTDLSDQDVENIRNSIRQSIKDFGSFELQIDHVEASPEGVFLITSPREPLISLHCLLHRAISEGWGKSADGESGKVYPHITVAYANSVGDATLLISCAGKSKGLEGQTLVSHVDLVWLNREADRYSWELVERFSLG
jgi:2'-5' RNA ligase